MDVWYRISKIKNTIRRPGVKLIKIDFQTEVEIVKFTDAGKVKYGAQGLGPIFSDATLNVLTSKNNANIEVRFNNVFPTSLSGLNLTNKQMILIT